ncbi:MAG: hypothetical protein HYY44_00750 [Deltaproteobacteria bacterium]|nr:hypothetical protein [Deltaproteobacteria bacterium]MBI4374763.1 hypothetical protein [Deltaproteobacteria bacterium]
MASGWLELPTLLRKWLVSEAGSQRIQNEESRKESPGSFDSELFQEQVRPGHTVLMGKFRIGNEVIQVTHSQWEGDSYLLSLQQRKQILRMTVLERIKKSPTAGSA